MNIYLNSRDGVTNWIEGRYLKVSPRHWKNWEALKGVQRSLYKSFFQTQPLLRIYETFLPMPLLLQKNLSVLAFQATPPRQPYPSALLARLAFNAFVWELAAQSNLFSKLSAPESYQKAFNINQTFFAYYQTCLHYQHLWYFSLCRNKLKLWFHVFFNGHFILDI